MVGSESAAGTGPAVVEGETCVSNAEDEVRLVVQCCEWEAVLEEDEVVQCCEWEAALELATK